MRTLSLLSLVLVTWSVTSPSLGALDCRVSGRPAATLLFPYFEVDLANPAGATTLISIGNTGAEPALANVVLWTDCAFPALSFFLYLPGDAVQPLNLRSILSGQLPVTGPAESGESFAGCTDPIDLPALDADRLAVLRGRSAGEPDPDDGLCYGSHRPGSQLAVGYLTVDVVSACSDTVRTPLDAGYFEAGGSGLASNDNVLWGDFFLVDAAGDSAQGAAAVSVVADPDYFAGTSRLSFYGRGFDGEDDERYPLGERYRTRHLTGGAFDGGTDVILWFERGAFPPTLPNDCEFVCGTEGIMVVDERDESGASVNTESIALDSITSRVTVGSGQLPVAGPFGTLDFQSYQDCPVCSPFLEASSWVMPIYTAEGRFSAGSPALRLDNPCD